MLNAGVVVAADQAQTKQEKQTGTRDREQIYGSQLMTREERTEHRARMRSLKSREEREAFRLEHHNKMQQRAREQGKTLPDMPPARAWDLPEEAVEWGPGWDGWGRNR